MSGTNQPPKGVESIDIAEQNQDFTREGVKDEIQVGDKVKHTRFYLGILRGTARKKLGEAIYEVIGITNRSITVRPWGSTQKYGSQFERRAIERAEKE